MELPFAFAFTAGLVATLNPCGFAMLPAYLSSFLGLEDDADLSASANAVRALRVGAVVSGGFLLVFGLAGLLLTLGLRIVVDALPWLAMVVGIGVVGLGLTLLTGRKLPIRLPSPAGTPGGGNSGMFWFGVSYAIASLSCTLPIFLAVVAGTIPQLGLVAGVATFVVYGLGMSTLLLLVTLAVAFGKRALLGRLRRASRHVDRAAGAMLVLAGGYIVFFWTTTLVSGGSAQPAAVRWMEQLSSWATNAVADAPGVIAAVALTALATVGLLVAVAARRRHAQQRSDTTTPPDGPTPSSTPLNRPPPTAGS